MGEIIGKFCSVAKKNTIIMPKEIPGYITPEGQVLKEDGQQIRFVYQEIQYKINYNLDGGKCDDYLPTSYTIRSHDIVPPRPEKQDYRFLGWEPEMIPHGSIGDVTFKAKWMPHAILLKGSKLSKALSTLAGGKENIIAIQHAIELPVGDYVNISSTSTPILAGFSDGIVRIWSSEDIYCNSDMKNAFSGFTILRDISGLAEFICKPNTAISGLFKNCALLSDVSPVADWAEGKFSDFTDAFTGTSALEAGRVPAWYRWEVKINYMSSTGKVLEVVTEDRIPGEVIYPKGITGYNAITSSVTITSPKEEYTFIYDPISYKISYSLDGGELVDSKKTSYTIEDETYYPPEAFKFGMKFLGWNPECIEQGEYGNKSFIANFGKERD